MGSNTLGPDAPSPLDGPIVPHNLMRSHGRPVPLLKFQIAPRHRLNVLWVQEKGVEICMSE